MCLDQSLVDTIIADGGPRSVDAAAERGFRYDASLPDGGEQIFPTDHALPIADQMKQKIEYLRFDRLEHAIPAQFATVSVQLATVGKI
jgi:hypothetical protein